MTVELVLGALLAAAAVVVVAAPFLRASDPPQPPEPRPEELVAAEERDRALAELKELEFDHRTGKITDEDYRALVQPLRQRAARTLANGATLPDEAAEPSSEQHFSEAKLPVSRQDR
jgi:hypothetical protein